MKGTEQIRTAIYARVSREEQLEGYSIDAQLRACRELAASRCWSVVREYVDEGRSARTEDIRKRPAFLDVVHGAEAREYDMLVVHKLDRFSRNLRITLEYFDRLGRCGVSFVSVIEQIDYSTPQGRLFFHMLGVLAQFYSDNLSQEIRKGKQERKAQGLWNGVVSFGYLAQGDGKGAVLVTDNSALPNGSTNYQGLIHMFRLAALGWSDAQIAKNMNAMGYRTTGNRGQNLWRKDSVRRVLLNRFYMGELPDGHGGWIPGRHTSILERDLFEAAEATRTANRNTQRSSSVNSKGRTYSLTGLLRCWYCEQSDDPRRGKIQISTQHDVPRTVCYSRVQGLDCPQRSATLTVYEEQIGQWLAGLEVPDRVVEDAVAWYSAQAKKVADPDEERRRLQGRLARIKELYGWGDMERGDYLVERDQIAARLRALAPAGQQRRDLRRAAELIRDIHETWQRQTPQERNHLLTKIVARIAIKDDQVVE